ncbi:bifunctional riboflavin kinase/FAD synthetase [Pontibacillus yanchengensis]|uniref:Riboflavin biosynthesis protein n=1 Tax=Pontibacillus yanchengensis Y32 TaxID=1385514 RepID=A0A0A2TDW7_9BACI|nr:bifunctional riboflavin kinase/FAD synthetase [Pontibacillus yanchengensis]KGP74032.1 riboflavin biosynthesis protein RibF [Pontibacillus yanchengensis Y32]
MDIKELQYPHTHSKNDFPESVVAIGYFDGVHKGHQKVIQTAIDLANEQGRESAVMTFHPHPSVVLKKTKQQIDLITPLEDKLKLLEEMGIDRVFLVTFDEDLAGLLPQEFVDHFFIGLNVQHVVAGFDFSYGKMGKGSMETLPFHSRGAFSQTVVQKVETDEEKVSSSYIREQLHQGDVGYIYHLLGRYYTIKGTVVKGEQRGRTIGFPTANIELKDAYILPKVGVYAVKVQIGDKVLNGMANIGYKPTFSDSTEKATVEVYVFDYEGDLYGQDLVVEWRKFIRNETKFDGVNALINQLKQDEQEIRAFFNDY